MPSSSPCLKKNWRHGKVIDLLLDTHALIWWLLASPRLAPAARDAITDPGNIIWVSAVSGFEVTRKFHLGKLPEADGFAGDVGGYVAAEGFLTLDVAIGHAEVAGRFDNAHRDPFDRLLIAQALTENMTLVSNERLFDGFGVKRLW
jgi:PIN domain nuclease of toxin-antitoxin system